jgi:pimeloyl-ACP methyl ester carboxylesterase
MKLGIQGVVLALAVFAGGGAQASGAQASGAQAASGRAPTAPAFVPGPCAVDVPDTPRRIDCGMLVVEETRGAVNGRRVAMPVAILRAVAPKGLPPLVYLHGGPGGGVVGNLARYVTLANAWFGQDQDVIFFDQRGGRLSAPSLDCGELALNDAGPDSPGTVAALHACAQRWPASGANLSRYNAAEVALDVQDLRRVLKLEQIDLFGVSYGTRIALEIVRDQPAGVRAVILDSLWPPEAKWAENGALPVAQAVRLILKLCREDPSCAVADKATLEPRLDALVRGWLKAPIAAAGGPPLPVDDFAQYLMDAPYSGEDARALPGFVSRLLAGDFAPLRAYDADRSPYVEGQHLTHLCKEQFPFESRAKTISNAGDDPLAQALARTLVRYFDACAGFPVGPPLAGDDRPVTSDLPILVLNAGIDPGCPPELAQTAVRRFSQGQLVILPFATHGVTRNSPCAAGLARAFLRRPTEPVDAACAGSEQDRFRFSAVEG